MTPASVPSQNDPSMSRAMARMSGLSKPDAVPKPTHSLPSNRVSPPPVPSQSNPVSGSMHNRPVGFTGGRIYRSAAGSCGWRSKTCMQGKHTPAATDARPAEFMNWCVAINAQIGRQARSKANCRRYIPSTPHRTEHVASCDYRSFRLRPLEARRGRVRVVNPIRPHAPECHSASACGRRRRGRSRRLQCFWADRLCTVAAVSHHGEEAASALFGCGATRPLCHTPKPSNEGGGGGGFVHFVAFC